MALINAPPARPASGSATADPQTASASATLGQAETRETFFTGCLGTMSLALARERAAA